MTRQALFFIRLTIKIESYLSCIVLPLAVYFVVVAGAYHGPDVTIIVIGAAIMTPITLVFGLVVRYIWLWPFLTAVFGDPRMFSPERLASSRIRILNYPWFEALMMTARWVMGITLTALYVLARTGMFGGVEYVLIIIIAIPVSSSLAYCTSENAVARLQTESMRPGPVARAGIRRPYTLYAKLLFIIISIIIIPIVIFGYLFFLSQAHLIRFQYINLHIGFITGLSLLTIILTAYESTRNIRLGMRLTVDTLNELRRGNLEVELPVFTRDEIGVIGENVNYLAESLRDQEKLNRFLMENLEHKVEQRTEELNAAMEELTAANEQLKEARDELWGEMELAKKIQTILLPHAPCVQGCEAAVYMAPARHVGGDYYDIINLPGVDWIVIGDVSGHGVSAGLVMMMAQTSIRTVLRNTPGIMPHRLLELVNDILYENLRMLSEERYMTMTAIALDPDGSFRYAGLHEDLLIYRAADGAVEAHETDGAWLGMYPDIRARGRDQALSLGPGDVLLLHTDGVVNAWKKETVGGQRNPEKDMFGAAGLIAILREHGKARPPDILGEIRQALGGYAPDDDATVVIIKRR
jgi:serine phosphatase RsbU (regulator of sigma subunit)